VTTDDFGYKIIGNDVYIFTGVTSTSNDEANIGFILANSRTGEYSFYSVPGAEEYSAMAAAEGSVQQYRYTASFPSLVNVDGEATYIMVLKDASGIVKMYSMVNVENYNIVVTSDTQADVFQKYKAALAGSGKKPEADVLESEEITVREIIYVTQNGNTYVYLKSSEGVFGMAFDESVLLIDEGDTVRVYYTKKNESGVTSIIKLEK
jgi:3D (Asp-Asp-Asp) domain-containing protein